MKFLFPCHEVDNKKVDDFYVEEHHAAKLQGHDCYLFDHDRFVAGDGFHSNIPAVDDDTKLILRGWMLSVPQYEEFYNKLKELGYILVNTPEQYKNCHHFPESYDYTKEHTSKAIFIKDFDADILQDISNFFGEKDFLMKDYVKSAKEMPELFRMPAKISGEDLLKKVEKFIEYRGKLFNEGLVFKEFIELDKDGSDNVNEWRIFYYENNRISARPNSNQKGPYVEAPDAFLKEVVDGIAFEIDSNFFTIDVAKKSDGSWMIIETGDGQVSGLSPNQNALEFYASMEEVQIKE